MTTIHTVTLPDGTTAKRTSEKRVYTHVIVRGPRAQADVVDDCRLELAKAEVVGARNRAIIDYVKGGGELVKSEPGSIFTGHVHAPGLPNQDPHRGLGWCGHDGRFLGTDGDTLAEQVIAWFEKQLDDDRVEYYRTRLAEAEAGPVWVGGWEAVTWASRLDLAAKAALTFSGRGREIRLMETERVTK